MKDGVEELQHRQHQEYTQWLESNDVYFASDLVVTTKEGVVAGWGCVAKADIPDGTVLFSIPREACFRAAAPVRGYDDSDDDSTNYEEDDPTTIDSQRELAIQLLRCWQTPNDGPAPFLRMLTPNHLPWTWPEGFRKIALMGTELEPVVEYKVKRIRREYEEIVRRDDNDGGEPTISYREYLNASAVVASHANPFFGVSIVPFNTTLNWGSVANVEFDLHRGNKHDEHPRIVGKAICDIKKGDELFQDYGDSVAELVYRCCFAPTNCRMKGDAVSIFMSDILSIAQKMWSSKGGGNHRLNSETHTSQEPRVITKLSSRIQALKQSGAIGESPWDGMANHLTAELTNPSKSFRSHSKHIKDYRTCMDQSDYDDGGVSKLVGVFLVLLADDDAWERASAALGSMGDMVSRHKRTSGEIDDSHGDKNNDGAFPHTIDSESEIQGESDDASDELSRTDDITASVLLSSIANLTDKQSKELQKFAQSAGRGEHDPWRALLFDLVRLDYSSRKEERVAKRIKTRQTSTTAKESIKWEVIFEATKSAICDRLNKSRDGETACGSLITDFANQNTKPGTNHGDESHGGEELGAEDRVEAISVVNILRGVEKGILVQAVEILEMSSLKLLGVV